MPEATHTRRLARTISALREVGDPLHRLDAIRAARQELEALETEAVQESRAAGHTWTEIGQLYGLTKQGAQQRFRRGSRSRVET